MKKYLLPTLILVALSGCAAIDNAIGYKSGTNVTAAQLQQFQIGKTKQSDILAVLGAPQEMTKVGDDTHLVYNYQEINNLSANKSVATRFVIGANGILKDVMQGAGNASNPLTAASH